MRFHNSMDVSIIILVSLDHSSALLMDGIHELFYKSWTFLPSQPFAKIGNQSLWPKFFQHFSHSSSNSLLGLCTIFNQFTRIIIPL
mmetsp:Transcript_88251/g.254525  ORF Transcript_88251/g.254525 Transcript_88251/m.254525 type:complete len:86 (+) Transcript_88251:58-315(+)